MKDSNEGSTVSRSNTWGRVREIRENLLSYKTVLSESIETSEQGVLDGETAIGMGLATAVNRLREQKSKSKVVILLTDGVNNKGSIDPMTAAQFAVEFDITVYTIGIGSNEKVKTPVAIHPITGEYIYDYIDVEIDEELLKKISSFLKVAEILSQYYFS